MAALSDSLVPYTFIAIVTYCLASTVFSVERLWAIANYVLPFVSYRLPFVSVATVSIRYVVFSLSVSQKTLVQVNW